MTIKTNYNPPPIPSREWDWTAWDDDNYSDDDEKYLTCPTGHGSTEVEAIEDLINNFQ